MIKLFILVGNSTLCKTSLFHLHIVQSYPIYNQKSTTNVVIQNYDKKKTNVKDNK